MINFKNRIDELRRKLENKQIDYYLIPSNDEFFNEYVPEYLNRLKYISGFSGSNGLALIGKKTNYFFTDGRYLLQAKEQLKNFLVKNLNELKHSIPEGKIGYNPELFNVHSLSLYNKNQIVACEDLIMINSGSESSNESEVFEYPLSYSGESSEEKINKLKDFLIKEEIDSIIITNPTNICWLLNIRAFDIPFNPVLLSRLIVSKSCNIKLFSKLKKLNHIECFQLSEFDREVGKLQNKKTQVDIESASVHLINSLKNPVVASDPCTLWKAIKNKTEITSAKKIHIEDGIAVTKFLFWLENNFEGKTELDIVYKIEEFRKQRKNYICPSFSTIAAFASNGAIIHYNPTKDSNKSLNKKGLFLLDSGGHYFGGTTDITRNVAIKQPSTIAQKRDFTLVLKGHIALASIIFPEGTTGGQLDVLARQFLWKSSKDFQHGTGHGVGNCLSVHEGPQRISKNNNITLVPGMILSNEPGYYVENEYGIRIENLMLVKEYSENFLCFETISMAPIDIRLIDFNMLEKEEKKWLKAYNNLVFKKVSKYLSDDEKQWYIETFS